MSNTRVRVNPHSIQSESTLRPDWLNGGVFVYKLIGCSFESSCSHLNNNLDVVLQKLSTQSLIPVLATFSIISATALNFYLSW